MRYPKHLLKLIDIFKKLPGVGTRTAERFAFFLLDWPEEKHREMSRIIQQIKENLKKCAECGALIEEGCTYCDKALRNQEILCIVASAKDIFLIEETREYQGLYHVLGNLISPLHGQSIDLEPLISRIKKLGVQEIIVALDSTLEGDATSLYIRKELASFGISITRLALGLPMGSSLDFIDSGTLARALAGRRVLH